MLVTTLETTLVVTLVVTPETMPETTTTAATRTTMEMAATTTTTMEAVVAALAVLLQLTPLVVSQPLRSPSQELVTDHSKSTATPSWTGGRLSSAPATSRTTNASTPSTAVRQTVLPSRTVKHRLPLVSPSCHRRRVEDTLSTKNRGVSRLGETTVGCGHTRPTFLYPL